MNPKVSTTMTIQRDNRELEVEIAGYAEPLTRGNYCGPPERCYPDEGGFAELEVATLNGQPFELTQEETEKAETLLYETFEDDMRDAADMEAEACFDDKIDPD